MADDVEMTPIDPSELAPVTAAEPPIIYSLVRLYYYIGFFTILQGVQTSRFHFPRQKGSAPSVPDRYAAHRTAKARILQAPLFGAHAV